MKKVILLSLLSLALLSLVISGCKKDVPQTLATITTSAITSIETTSVVSGGDVTSNGNSAITEQGVCWGSVSNPTTSNSKKVDNSGLAIFSVSITDLIPGSTYHIRAYATNTIGTAYGEDVTFTTDISLPIVSTASISSILTTSAVSGGSISFDGGSPITFKGVCWSSSTNPTISDSKTSDGTGLNSYTSDITNLAPSTNYHVRAYASNALGTAYGSDILFTTISDQPTLVDNDNMLLGNPSGATIDTVNHDNYLMVKPQYCLSYSRSRLIPNWTSWHLYSGDLGSAIRQDDYRADATLPAGWYQVGASDYQFSIFGFDRGHMCPAADRSSSDLNISATFYMTNMIPQAPKNNQSTWENFESYCRGLVNSGNELYIICGSSGQGGVGSKSTSVISILNSGVIVPSITWKIAVVLTNGDNDLSRITTSTRVIAVWMPNTQSILSTWTGYRVSVDYIETQTGYDFLSNVSTSIQNVIEANVDNL